jgi:hypothetical protein
VLHWFAPSTGLVSFTLVMAYAPGDNNRQAVTIDVAEGTQGLALDAERGLVVRGPLALVWFGWIGEFLPMIYRLL